MEIRPFRGWRYGQADVSPVIAPPYDILSAQDKQELLGNSPQNIVAVDLPHVPPKEVGPDQAYRSAAQLLRQWQSSGVLRQDGRPALYAYEQTFVWAGKTYSRRALIAGVRATELGKDVIPHEHTFAGPKADRLKLMQHTGVQLSPIFGFYDDADGTVTTALAAATSRGSDLHGELRGVIEKLWAITDQHAIGAISKALSAVPVFIADGHHRYTTALNYRDWLASQKTVAADNEANFVMFALVAKDDPGLLILPTHRIIRGLAGDFDVQTLVSRATEFQWQAVPLAGADLSDADEFLKPFGQGAMALLGAGSGQIWVGRLKDASAMEKAAPQELPAWRGLDVAILHKLIIDKALSPWRTDATAIDYTPDGKAVRDAVADRSAQLGVCLQGTPLKDVEAIATAGGYMPHKSTYFYPKLATGMVIKPLE